MYEYGGFWSPYDSRDGLGIFVFSIAHDKNVRKHSHFYDISLNNHTCLSISIYLNTFKYLNYLVVLNNCLLIHIHNYMIIFYISTIGKSFILYLNTQFSNYFLISYVYEFSTDSFSSFLLIYLIQ